MLMLIALAAVLGLLIGSYLSCITYRTPRGKQSLRGSSFCPHCKKNIKPIDNIPVLSFLLLKGRCRNCKKPISVRYPIIELTTSILFVLSTYITANCSGITVSPVCSFVVANNFASHLFVWSIVSVVIAIFIVDLEEQIIPDSYTFFGIGVTLLYFFTFNFSNIFPHIFAGVSAALFLLLLHLITKGRGMGLGDVKLAIFAGLLLGPIHTVVFLFLSFLTGAVVGTILLIVGSVKFGRTIAFGPYLVISLIGTLIWGDTLLKFFWP